MAVPFLPARPVRPMLRAGMGGGWVGRRKAWRVHVGAGVCGRQTGQGGFNPQTRGGSGGRCQAHHPFTPIQTAAQEPKAPAPHRCVQAFIPPNLPRTMISPSPQPPSPKTQSPNRSLGVKKLRPPTPPTGACRPLSPRACRSL